jgi:hypothetical protein
VLPALGALGTEGPARSERKPFMIHRKAAKSNTLNRPGPTPKSAGLSAPRPKPITQDELQNLLSLMITVRTAGDELTHRVAAGARIERGAWTVRTYPETYPGEPLIIPSFDHVLGAIDELEGR